MQTGSSEALIGQKSEKRHMSLYGTEQRERGYGLYFYRLCFKHENQLISASTQSQYLKTTTKFDLIQNKLRLASLGTDQIENERFGLVFAKTIIFTSKTGSIISGTSVVDPDLDPAAYILVGWIRIRIGNTVPDSGGPKWPTKVKKIQCQMFSFEE